MQIGYMVLVYIHIFNSNLDRPDDIENTSPTNFSVEIWLIFYCLRPQN